MLLVLGVGGSFVLRLGNLHTAGTVFEGRIQAVITRGSETTPLLYTVGTNQLRIEVTATNWPHPVNIVELSSGALTLVYPHNRSYMRLKSAPEKTAVPPPDAPPFPAPSGIGPQSPIPAEVAAGTPPPGQPAAGIGPQGQLAPGPTGIPAMPQTPAPPVGLPPGVGPQAEVPGGSAMPTTPAMPMMPMRTEKLELKATGDKTNLLGYACERFECKQRGETLEIWATDQLLAFQPYLRNRPHRFGFPILEEQWPALLQQRRLFPVRVTLRSESSPERYRFEVQAVWPGKVTDPDGKLFRPPSDYLEIEPLPF